MWVPWALGCNPKGNLTAGKFVFDQRKDILIEYVKNQKETIDVKAVRDMKTVAERGRVR
jgi:hypothetical protein